IGAEVMDALAAAHRVGVLHRDVKPGNILLDRSGRVVLTDFGIATMDDPGDGSATHLTRSGEIVGSLDYLAPERAQGADPGPASDVWALGATLYAAVEGSSPFRRTSTFSTLTAIVGEPLPEPRRAGPLTPVLRMLMDKRPQSRPDADEARRLLEAVAHGTPLDDAATAALRSSGTSAPSATRTETERVTPAVPPGFGPPQQPPAAPAHDQGYGQAGPGAHPAAGAGAAHPPAAAATAPTGPMDTGSRSRRRGRVLRAAVAVAVVLATAGTTVALLNDGNETRASEQMGDPGARETGSSGRATLPDESGRSQSPEEERGETAGTSPSGRPG